MCIRDRNRENLLFELDTLIRSLEQYREAIQEDDFAALCQLLEEGRRIKEEMCIRDRP